MSKFTILMIAVLISAVAVTIISFIASYFEYKDWNNGVCPKCGKPLRCFDTDSTGGEGWTCDDCDYTTWVSYHTLVYEFWKKRSKK